MADKVGRLESRVSLLSLKLRCVRSADLSSRAQMEDMIGERVSAKEAALHATYDERLRNYDERYVLLAI